MRRLPVILLCAAAAVPACARTVPSHGVEDALAAIHPREIRAHMEFLAADALEGRATGERGYEIAARYVAAQMLSMGLEPVFDGSWFQPVPFRSAETVRVELAVTGGGGGLRLQRDRDFVVAPNPFELETSLEAPVAYAGFGIVAPEAGHDDYVGVDVRGRVLVLVSGAPSRFANHLRAYYAQTRLKLQEAADRGAVGVLFISLPSEAARNPWDLTVLSSTRPAISWLTTEGMPMGTPPAIRLRGTLSPSGATALFARAGRPLAEVLAEAEAGTPKALPLDVSVRLRQTSRHSRIGSPNVAGILRGADPALADEHVTYVAHLDHLGVDPEGTGDRINNGAYDNASGVAIMLEVARAFTRLPDRPARSLLFLAVTAEEVGLLGAEYFVHHPPVPLDHIVANVSLDMFLMLFPLRDVIAFGAEHSSLGPVVERVANRIGISVSPDPMPEEVIFIRSDQFRFVQKGVPALFLVHGLDSGDPSIDGAELTTRWRRERYHRPGDDMHQEMDFKAGADFARLNLLVGLEIANARERPAWNDGDFFGEKYASGQ